MTIVYQIAFLYEAKCIVCGSYSCQENCNHQKVTFKSMENSIHDCMNLLINIDQNQAKLTNNHSCRTQFNQLDAKFQTDSLISKQKSKSQFSKMIKKIHNFFNQPFQKFKQNSILFEVSKAIMMKVLKKHKILYFNYCQIIDALNIFGRVLNQRTILKENQFQLEKVKNYSQAKNYRLFKLIQEYIKQLKIIKEQLENMVVNKENYIIESSSKQTKKYFKSQKKNIILQQLTDVNQLSIQQNVTFFIELIQKFRKNKNTSSKLITNPQLQINNQIQIKLLKNFRQKIAQQEIKFAPERKTFEKAIKVSTLTPQQIDYNDCLYIQGIKFPSNRKHLDFSILDMTDHMLFSYIPTLDRFFFLQQLCLRHNKLSPISFRLLKNTFSNLKSLDIRENLLTDQNVSQIVKFKNLSILYISDCQISCTSLVKISIYLQNLHFLYADNIRIYSGVLSDYQEAQQYYGIFYILALNLKKLAYLNIKNRIIQAPQQTNLSKISEILQKRKGYLQI